MLSSLAKYIFGGIMADAPETTPMHYETREVNDWLLVDTPDQAIDNEDLDSECESLDSECASLDSEDDILTALPRLMTEESYICDNSFTEINMPLEQSCQLGTKKGLESSFLEECIEHFQIMPDSMYLNQSFYYPSDYSLVVSRIINGTHCTTTRNPEECIFHRGIVKETESGEIVIIKIKGLPRKPSPLPDLFDKRFNHPAAYSKNFINHRSPNLSPKTALLEQVKNMKSGQKAIENDAKKYLTRTQLKRQNRNYIYESSVKTNRRRNLQRNPSGANNNRKCC